MFKKKRFIFTILGIIILLFTIPINFDRIYEWIDLKKATYVSQEEEKALQFLKNQPEGIVLTTPYDKTWKNSMTEPYPLYAYADTAYISAFSGKQVHIADEIQLELLVIDYKQRRQKVLSRDCDILNKINYVYEIKKLPAPYIFSICNKPAKKIFENSEVIIYKT